MNRVLIWDLPTRLFHWLLSAGFLVAAAISLLAGEHSRLFPYHAIIGLAITLMVCLRLIWGVVGTRYARLNSFVYGPAALVEYVKGTLVGGGKCYIGHNPASAVAIFALLALVLAMAVTGIMLGRGNEGVKEIHEVLAYVTVGVVVVHVLGVLLHIVRHRENIIASMIHGRKAAEATEGISSARPIIALVFLAISGLWTFGLVRNFNAATQTTKLPLLGTVLTLGENEGGKEAGGRAGDKDSDDR